MSPSFSTSRPSTPVSSRTSRIAVSAADSPASMWPFGRAQTRSFPRGRVLAVGPGSRDDNGKFVPMDLEEGDEIVFSKYGGTEIRVGTDEYLILRESDVLAKVTGDREPAGATA